jgi:fructan beta-fructosidase
MVLYLDRDDYGLFTSPDLKEWTRQSHIRLAGATECPDLFDLPVDGDVRNRKWVFLGGNGNYLIGTFDGRQFIAEQDQQTGDWGANFYATQTFNNLTDGRRIQMAWMSGGKYPAMPFNQQMSFPCELSLKSERKSLRLCRNPVPELALLHEKECAWSDVPLTPDANPLAGLRGDLFDIQVDWALGDATEVGLRVRGATVKYSVSDHALTCLGKGAPVSPSDGHVRLQLLVDRTSLEVFANDGQVSMTSCFLPKAKDKSLDIYATGSGAHITKLKVYPLDSAWQKPDRK